MMKEQASRIMDILLSMEGPIGELDSIVSAMPEGDERRYYVKALGDMMNIMTCDLVLRIAREFPDLDPDKDAEWRKK